MKTLMALSAAAMLAAAPALAQNSNPGATGTAGSADGAPASGMNNGATMGSNAPMDPGMSAPSTSAASSTTMSHDKTAHATKKKTMKKRPS